MPNEIQSISIKYDDEELKDEVMPLANDNGICIQQKYQSAKQNQKHSSGSLNERQLSGSNSLSSHELFADSASQYELSYNRYFLYDQFN